MQPTTKPFLVLVLMAGTLRAEIVIGNSSPDESTSNLVKGLVKIVTSCYQDQINTVGLVGNLPDTLARTLSVQHLIPITLMADSSPNMTNIVHPVYPVNNEFRHKLQVFIVGASYKQLGNIVGITIKTSIWWNHMASFLILDQSHGCDNVVSLLLVAWQFDLLNAKVMCYHYKYGGYIFNYNPFTSQAPVQWRQFTVVAGINNHPFTVFARKYQKDETRCVNLDFVKTTNLGG